MDKSKMPKILLKNIAWIIAFIIVGLSATSLFLSLITRHGHFVEVPDMVGMQVDEALAAARSAHLRIEVCDSNFVRTVDPGAVYLQDPAAGSQVKKDRHIRLSVNTMTARRISLPNVLECPLRQAVSELTSKGFMVGRIHYVPGYDDRVIAVTRGGRELSPGNMIESGSTIDLKVGQSDNAGSAIVPSVIGKKAAQAAKEIQEHSLNVRTSYDASVKTADDRRRALVFKQSPEAGRYSIAKGTDVTIHLTIDPEKLEK